ncbi:toll/interleukin-1 receptor domain-containing protein [Amycolatopsis sp. A133]|uniref:toll/interleukin-1 receptor domain-containing protein n=1 Tax=Amycolatopsis sp. A133 TaxID=3064472 RepID=UPI0027F92900|nr:toll/interleukin-1 receptor domain-containing protein [Amycolatopsis sp. A133]MDQ7802475.1 toll/interleukin-1 receptor domain-containing protein [Amycolatopsis sp. A133]
MVADGAAEPADLAGAGTEAGSRRVTAASLVRMVVALGLPDADPYPVVAALARQCAELATFGTPGDLRPVEVPDAAGRLLYNGVAVTTALAHAHHDLVAVPVLTRLVLRMFDLGRVTAVPGEHLRVAVREPRLEPGDWRRRQWEQAREDLTETQFDAFAGLLRDDVRLGAERFVSVPLPGTDGEPGEDGHRPPTVFVSYAHDSPAHKDQVRRFAELLRDSGAEVVLDQWVPPGRQDWGTWAVRAIVRCDFTIVIASPDYKRAADDLDDSLRNPGVQSEAAVIRDELHGDRPRWKRKLLPVVLPGHTKAEIPYFLQPHSADRYHVGSLDADGIADLMAVLTAGHADRITPPAGAPLPDDDEVSQVSGTTRMTAYNYGTGRVFQAGRDQHITGA